MASSSSSPCAASRNIFGKSRTGSADPWIEPRSDLSKISDMIGIDTSSLKPVRPTAMARPPVASASKAWRTTSALPTDSIARSTPPSVSSWIAATGSPSIGDTPSVAPSRRASASRAGFGSTAMIRDAPAIRAPCTADSPTPPQPKTATLSPQRAPPVMTAAPKPVVTPQPTLHADRNERSSQTGIAVRSFTTTNSESPDTLM